MDKKTTDILKFILDWNYLLIEPPVDGEIAEVYFCFIASSQSKGKDKVSWLQFIKCLRSLNDICSGNAFTCHPANALSLHYEDPFKCFNRITDINRLGLALIFKHLKGNSTSSSANSYKTNSKTAPLPLYKRSIPKENSEKFDLLMKLIEGPETKIGKSTNDIYSTPTLTHKGLIPKDTNDIYTTTSRSRRLDQLNYLLFAPCGSNTLSRERARMRTPISQFFDCCDDSQHAQSLTMLTTFDKQTNYCKLDISKMNEKLRTNDQYTNCLNKCVNEKIHYIPIIQQQTDIKLGDCSYLDTCHKMNSCRYIHYGQLMPQDLSLKKEVVDHNDQIEESLRISDYTRGEVMSPYTRTELPAQWINCDVTKLDFKILGNKFAIIIADPSWTIHMNLNYSSLTDSDLLSLRMDLLQEEGLFLLWVTGRTIETGRDFLKKWGYDVMNQITWVKTNQLIRTISTGRTGHWLNHSKEHLLVGLKGNPKWLNKCMDPQILISSTRETSRKPDEIYGMVDRLVGPRARKLEIFGRQHNTRPGWLTIGNQLGSTNLVEKEISEKYFKVASE